MDAASDVEWPDGAVPIYHAAFEQPFSADNLDTLGSWLRNFSLDDDRRIVVGHLETEKFALKQSAVSVEERGFEFLWVSDDLDIVSTIYRPSDPKTSTGVPAGLGDLLHRHADFVWEAMTTALSSLVIAGTASVYARPGSPLAPVVRIPSDAWTHFIVTDWRAGLAECKKSGDCLYSPRVTFLAGIEPKALSPDAAIAWLTAEAEKRDRTGLPPMTIEEVLEASVRFGQSREWARAFRRSLPATAKLAPGEKRADRLRLARRPA